jgi:flagellar assembly factor FliW
VSQITTRPFGAIEINDDEILDFPDGLFGFDELKKFIILEEKDSPMVWLQSCDETDLAFVLLKVENFMPVYNPLMSQSDKSALKANDEKDLDIYAILTIPQDDPSKMTANLMGPVVINPKEKLGRQVISQNENYKTKHSVLDELKRKKEA